MTLVNERSFEVPVPVERAWAAMTDPEELDRWYFPVEPVGDDGSIRAEICGVERTTEVIGGELHRFFHTRTELSGREGFGVVPGTREMRVTFEPTGQGTRVTITHSGWPDTPEGDCDRLATAHGSGESIADLQLYLRTGLPFPRHHHGVRCDLGLSLGEGPAGLEVRAVQPGGFGQRAGLAAGDLLVELDGASLFGLAEVAFFTKLRSAGEKAHARWIRHGTLMEGEAELGERIIPGGQGREVLERPVQPAGGRQARARASADDTANRR
jgi:uncharacterized protein YndB with AHSA1/START domain